MKVQTSRDGRNWRDLSVVGLPVTFKSKKAARAWFDQLEDANRLDWKVGFLHSPASRSTELSRVRSRMIKAMHLHKADRVRVQSATQPGQLRRTGVTLLETCTCGYERSVWVTSFKVEPAAWQAPEVPADVQDAEEPFANDWKGRP